MFVSGFHTKGKYKYEFYLECCKLNNEAYLEQCSSKIHAYWIIFCVIVTVQCVQLK